jgi:hypothetical protein
VGVRRENRMLRRRCTTFRLATIYGTLLEGAIYWQMKVAFPEGEFTTKVRGKS